MDVRLLSWDHGMAAGLKRMVGAGLSTTTGLNWRLLDQLLVRISQGGSGGGSGCICCSGWVGGVRFNGREDGWDIIKKLLEMPFDISIFPEKFLHIPMESVMEGLMNEKRWILIQRAW